MKKTILLIIILLNSLAIFAQPTTISYQGILTDDEGNPLNGNKSLSFSIFLQETGGTSIWNESHLFVNVDEGLFNVELGSATSFGTIDFSQELWLEISVDGTTMTPRIPFNASSYSMVGKTSLNLAGGATGSLPYQTAAGETSMLNAGTAGQILTMNGSGTAPVWANGLSTTLSGGYLYVGNSTDEAQAREITGDVTINNTGVTAIGTSKVTNNMLAGSISDTKLSTISTSGKVSNSATTATTLNTANTIVLRDASGNFTAGTITADLTGTADKSNDLTGGAAGSIPFQTGDGATSMLSVGTEGQVLSLVNGFPQWAAAYSGLTNFTESNFTYDAKTGVKFTPNNAAANVDVVISPKGTGAVLASQPDGTTIGGNNRGANAVDLQRTRMVNSHVASGTASVIIGGSSNTASGNNSVIVGGYFNEASGYRSTAMGSSTNATGDYSTAMGEATIAPSAFEIAIGRNNTEYAPLSTTGWNSNDKLFVIGNGEYFFARSNALTILKNANTTIGGSLTINGNGTNTSYLFPSTRGTNGQVLQTDGNGNMSWTNPYTGLTNFTESNYTYNSKTGVKLLAANSATNVDLIVSPKGSGALTAQQPDGTTTGGNNRGNYAVDWQMSREFNTQVSSGHYSVTAGGKSNSASGLVSVVSGGESNSSSGIVSVVSGGIYNVSSGNGAVVGGGTYNTSSKICAVTGGGEYNMSKGDYSIVGGGSLNTSNGNFSIVSGGSNNISNGDYSVVLGGSGNTSPSYGEVVMGYYSSNYTTGANGATQPNATDRLLSIGNGTDSERSNALTILKNANTTIGGSLTINGNGITADYTFPTNRGTNGQVIKTNADGTTTWANPEEAGTETGQMKYWNGTAWVTIASGQNGQILTNISGVPTWVNNDLIYVLDIGVHYQGGIIAYFLQPGDPGYDANVRHGIIAAPSDQSTGAQWGCYGTRISGADGIALGSGLQNTQDIVIGCNTIGIAARICNDLVLNGYNDWYLPSKDELNKLYLNRTAIGGFSSTSYWSSSEENGEDTMVQDFSNGSQHRINKDVLFRVRAIRSF